MDLCRFLVFVRSQVSSKLAAQIIVLGDVLLLIHSKTLETNGFPTVEALKLSSQVVAYLARCEKEVLNFDALELMPDAEIGVLKRSAN